MVGIIKNQVWTDEEINQYLTITTTPLRLASINRSGYPVIVPLWYHWNGEYFWLVTHKNAKLLQYLQSSARVGYEIANNEPPYKGVRGQGEVEIIFTRGAEILSVMLDKYLSGVDSPFTRWLLSRQEDEVAIKLYPQTLIVWDYQKRMMRDSNTEESGS